MSKVSIALQDYTNKRTINLHSRICLLNMYLFNVLCFDLKALEEYTVPELSVGKQNRQP